MLSAEQHRQLGEELYLAMRRQTTVAPLTSRYNTLSIDDAYRVSQIMLQHRLELDGEKIVGKKIGVTSPVVQKMLGVFQPDFGFLTDAMQYREGARIPLAGQLIQPRAEAEIAFCLKSDLQGPGVNEAQVLAATDYIAPCFEIVDSRIRDWQIKIEDTIADNASCGVFVLGDARADPRHHQLSDLKISVFKNSKFLSEGFGSAVQGNPLTAVAWLANTLGNFGIALKAGEIILSGSLVPLEPAAAGDTFTMELHGIGGAACSFV